MAMGAQERYPARGISRAAGADGSQQRLTATRRETAAAPSRLALCLAVARQ